MVGVSESKTPFVLFCDSSNVIKPNFLELSLPHFDDNLVSACFGRIMNHESLDDTLSKWRAVHLFQQNDYHKSEPHTVNCLITYAVLLRKEHIIKVGNFDPNLKQCEDQDMGEKLLDNNYKLISEPKLITYSLRKESLKSLYMRYLRWNSHYKHPRKIITQFFITSKSSFLIFARKDLRNRDFVCMTISILLPFVLLLNDLFSKCRQLYENE